MDLPLREQFLMDLPVTHPRKFLKISIFVGNLCWVDFLSCPCYPKPQAWKDTPDSQSPLPVSSGSAAPAGASCPSTQKEGDKQGG